MNYDFTYGDTTGSQFSSLVGSYVVVSSIIGLALCVFALVVMWKLFVKAGKPGWAAIVPFYNTYVLFEITWGNGWMFLTIFLSIIPLIGWIAAIVIMIITMIKLAKAFGKSDGFAVGLIFLSIIFEAIIAFDDSTYLGVPGK